jgi:hypothetical protein
MYTCIYDISRLKVNACNHGKNNIGAFQNEEAVEIIAREWA